jgi:hypothetical protein
MKKIGMLLLVLVIAVGTLGVGYAHWWDWSYIRGEVQTGELCVGITDFTEYDECVDPPYPGVLFPLQPYPGQADFDGQYDIKTMGVDLTRYEKNVACCDFTLIDARPDVFHDNDQVYSGLQGVLYNGYPSYWNLVDVEFANCGTVPAGLLGVWIRGYNNDTGSWGPWILTQPDPNRNGTYDATNDTYPYVYGLDMDGDDRAEVNVWTHWPGQPVGEDEWINQLDPCDRTILWFDIHVNQAADENATYQYQAYFGWVNWNQLDVEAVNPNPGG